MENSNNQHESNFNEEIQQEFQKLSNDLKVEGEERLLKFVDDFNKVLEAKDGDIQSFIHETVANLINEIIILKYKTKESEYVLSESTNQLQTNLTIIQELQKILEEKDKLSKEKEDQLTTDMVNLQKRTANEIENNKKFAIKNFATSMVQIQKYLTMALNDTTGDIKVLQDGVSMTRREMLNEFAKFGLTQLDSEAGKLFNPNQEEAVGTFPSEENKNFIYEVLELGWKLHDRVIIPSRVIVYM